MSSGPRSFARPVPHSMSIIICQCFLCSELFCRDHHECHERHRLGTRSVLSSLQEGMDVHRCRHPEILDAMQVREDQAFPAENCESQQHRPRDPSVVARRIWRTNRGRSSDVPAFVVSRNLPLLLIECP